MPPKPREILVNKEFIVTRVANGFMLRLPEPDPNKPAGPEKTIHVFSSPESLAIFVQNWAKSVEAPTPKGSGPSYTD